MIETEQRSPHF